MNLAVAILACAMLVAFPSNSSAATFDRVSWRNHDVLLLSGPIEPGDFSKFINAVSTIEPLPHGYRVLLLDSPGGSVSEALAISEALKAFNVHTVIPDGARCASACGSIVFVGGVARTVDHFGLLGQHSCSSGGARDEDCNAVISQHGFRNGVSYGSISAFITYTSPDDIMWFSREDVDGWGISLYPGSREVSFEKSEPRVSKSITGNKPPAQSLWRIDFRFDGFAAFLRPASDDERELELNVFCDELSRGRLFLSMAIHGPAQKIEQAIHGALISTDVFEWNEAKPTVLQYDALVTEVVFEVPQESILEFLSDANTLSITLFVADPFQPINASTFLSRSRENLIFAANHCVNQTKEE